MSGYLSNFCEFVENIKKAAIENPPTGSVRVHDDNPAVKQLWNEIRGVIDVCNAWMMPMLKLFDIEKGNGVCELAVENYETPNDS